MNRKRIIACLTALLIGTGCLMAQVAGKEWRVKKISMNESSHRARTATARAPKGVRTTLKYEQIADMKSARKAHQTFATGNGFMVGGGTMRNLQPPRPPNCGRMASGRPSRLSELPTPISRSRSVTAA